MIIPDIIIERANAYKNCSNPIKKFINDYDAEDGTWIYLTEFYETFLKEKNKLFLRKKEFKEEISKYFGEPIRRHDGLAWCYKKL